MKNVMRLMLGLGLIPATAAQAAPVAVKLPCANEQAALMACQLKNRINYNVPVAPIGQPGQPIIPVD